MSDPYIPENTRVELKLSENQNSDIDVTIQLPNQKEPVNFNGLNIADGTLYIPIKTVFLCHTKEDREEVINIQDKLHSIGIIGWRDQSALRGGDEWKPKIFDAIESSDYAIIFISQNAKTNNGFFQEEARKIDEVRKKKNRFLIPIILDNSEIPEKYKDIHCLKATNDIIEGLKKAII